MAPNITFNHRGILGFYGNSIHLFIVNFIDNFQQIGAQYEPSKYMPSNYYYYNILNLLKLSMAIYFNSQKYL